MSTGSKSQDAKKTGFEPSHAIRRSLEIRDAATYLADYMGSYNRQDTRLFGTSIYVDDVLYGLGVSLDSERYSYADGFRQFKADLLEYLQPFAYEPFEPAGEERRFRNSGADRMNERESTDTIVAYRLQRSEQPGWCFAGTQPSEVAEAVRNELLNDAGEALADRESITVEPYETTVAEIESLPEFEGW